MCCGRPLHAKICRRSQESSDRLYGVGCTENLDLRHEKARTAVTVMFGRIQALRHSGCADRQAIEHVPATEPVLVSDEKLFGTFLLKRNLTGRVEVSRVTSSADLDKFDFEAQDDVKFSVTLAARGEFTAELFQEDDEKVSFVCMFPAPEVSQPAFLDSVDRFLYTTSEIYTFEVSVGLPAQSETQLWDIHEDMETGRQEAVFQESAVRCRSLFNEFQTDEIVQNVTHVDYPGCKQERVVVTALSDERPYSRFSFERPHRGRPSVFILGNRTYR